ncbi:MAG: TonB-dependent receptor [Methylotenera sp.]
MTNPKYLALFILLVAGSTQLTAAAEAISDVAGEKSVWPQIVASQNLSEDDYMGEVPKVLTVSRLSQSLADTPSAVTVIGRETIRASGIVDLPEIFRLVPGFYVGTNAGFVYNTNHAVSYHGMTSAYPGSMQVMINGRSVYSPLFGGVNWSELPLAIADIERIEITRGPNAASYGANSFFGVVNIITQHPSDVAGNSVMATHGDGRNEAFYRHAGKLNNLSYRFTAGYREDDGLENRNDFKRTRLLNAQADYQVNEKNNLEFEFGLADGERGEGNINEDAIIFLPRTKDISNHYGLIRWRHNISDTSDFSLQGYHSYDRSDDETTSINIRPLLPARFRPFLAVNQLHIKNEVVQERTDIEAQHTFSVGNNIRAVWGGSIRQDSMYAPYYLASRKTDYFDLQRLFGHVEWRSSEKLTFNTGAMLEHNDFTGTDVSPRASINFKPNPNHTFRLGISSALRTPNYLEEKFQDRLVIPTTLPTPNALVVQFRANKGNVNPEQIISRELGYMGKIGGLQLDMRLFSDRYNDVIRFRPRTIPTPPNTLLLNGPLDIDINSSLNEGSAAVEGIEWQANWQLSSNTKFLFNHAYVHIRETQDGLKRNFIDSAPSNTVSALVTHKFDQNWDASFAYYQISKVTQLGDGDPVDLIRKCDVRLARKFNSGPWNGEVSAVVENLFNNHYQEFADYNTLKRRARINLRLDF